ncbi:hypothetical protein HYW87_02645 [Candidatus Roizmanbacteria bacterium]|nr:hypothetical protein [Candidatus Roizmanbacteria bacterium]
MQIRRLLSFALLILLIIIVAQLLYLFIFSKRSQQRVQNNKNPNVLYLYYKVGRPDTKYWGTLPRISDGLLETGKVVSVFGPHQINRGLFSAFVDGDPYSEKGNLYIPLRAEVGNESISFRMNLKGKAGVFLVKSGIWGEETSFVPYNLEDIVNHLQKDRQIVINFLGTGGNLDEICKYSKNECSVLEVLQSNYATSNDNILKNGLKNNDEIGYISNIVIAVP